MFLNHGLAIVKYKSRDEAIKAQSALNNCSLGNTTIQVQIANETEVQQYLANCQIVNNSSSVGSVYNSCNVGDYMITASNNGAWNGGASNLPTTTLPNASNMWSFNQNQPNNLWNSNSNLQNLLPDNLLSDNLLEST